MDRVDSPIMLEIVDIKQETDDVRTFSFEYDLKSQPGQFVMLWVPGVDQKPFSIGGEADGRFHLSIFEIGPATQALFKMKKADRVGITGPYGTAYKFEPKSDLITVGGGYGAAPLVYLAEQALDNKCDVDFLVGARSKKHLLFEKRAKKAGADVHVATDDGSHGHDGYVTDILDQLLDKKFRRKKLDKTKVYTCGPELMQKKVAELCKVYKVPCEISIERYMKCGFGICGNCAVDDEGMRTCVSGPVISGTRALKIKEFGNYHRDKMGISHEF